MDKFFMAMGINFMNRPTLSAMTLTQVAESPSSQLGPFEQQWRKWNGMFPKKYKIRREMRQKGLLGHLMTHGDVR